MAVKPSGNGATADGAGIGRAIRARRRELGLSLRELGERAGLSIGFLSQVERGQSSLALGSLSAVAAALGVEVADLFPGERRAGRDAPVAGGMVHVARADEPTDFAIDATIRRYKLLAGRYDRVLEPMLVTVYPADTREEVLRSQSGEKFIYVLEGELVYIVDQQEYVLRRGDSIHHSASVPHAFANESGEVVTILSVVTPPIL